MFSGYILVEVMLIIGHRGAASAIVRENTIEALREGKKAGADMLEFDIRLTKDKVPILIHDFTTLRTHGHRVIVSRTSLEDLQSRTTNQPITLLNDVLDEFYGNIILNIELKSRGAGKAVVTLLEKSYITSDKDWDNVLISSFRGSELMAVRKHTKKANLGLLHNHNPFLFVAYHRLLHLTAVGFHRLYINPLALEIAKRSNLFTYVYTVNRPAAARLLTTQGLDGIVTDSPASILKDLQKS
jgi:glycerophosphoryl diester phosphodiesterase